MRLVASMTGAVCRLLSVLYKRFYAGRLWPADCVHSVERYLQTIMRARIRTRRQRSVSHELRGPFNFSFEKRCALMRGTLTLSPCTDPVLFFFFVYLFIYFFTKSRLISCHHSYGPVLAFRSLVITCVLTGWELICLWQGGGDRSPARHKVRYVLQSPWPFHRP